MQCEESNLWRLRELALFGFLYIIFGLRSTALVSLLDDEVGDIGIGVRASVCVPKSSATGAICMAWSVVFASEVWVVCVEEGIFHLHCTFYNHLVVDMGDCDDLHFLTQCSSTLCIHLSDGFCYC